MKHYWRMFADKIDVLSLRERALIFLMTAAVLVATINKVMIEPIQTKQKKISTDLSQKQGQLVAIQQQIQSSVGDYQADPDAANRTRVTELKKKLENYEDALQSVQSSLVTPDKMAQVLQDILAQGGMVRLLSMVSLPPRQLVAPVGKQVHPGTAPKKSLGRGEELLYRHGVRIVIEGGYSDLLQYLVALERLPWRMSWDEVTLKVDSYPKITLSLTLYTLSLDKTWLSV